MAPSVDSSRNEARVKKPVVAPEVAPEGESKKTPDAEQALQTSTQTQFGNQAVQDAISGEGGALGDKIAGDITAANEGRGALSATGAGMSARGNAAMAQDTPRHDPSRDEALRQTDREASIQHEIDMGMDLGFSRTSEMSKGEGTSNIPKEGTGRREGVLSGPSKNGHLAVNEYMDVMKSIGPDGKETRSRSDENIRAPAMHTHSENDGHVHLDNSPHLGAEPEGADRKKPLPPPST